MDIRNSVIQYQYGERIKSELMLSSQLITVLFGLKDSEMAGGRKIVLQFLEGVRNDVQYALNETHNPEFNKVISPISQAISMVESNTLDPVLGQIGLAISAATTVAQNAWQELSTHGYI